MALKLSSGFEIAKFSDLQYQGMTVEIRFNGIPVAQVNKDLGGEKQEITLPSRFSPQGIQFTFPLADFIEALNAAQAILSKL